MKLFDVLMILFFTLQSCIPSSKETIKKLNSIDESLIKKFGLIIEGKTVYQLYQKYGFTDVEARLIMVVIPSKTESYDKFIPLDSLRIENDLKLNIEKFLANDSINFKIERDYQNDIRLESMEFDLNEKKEILLKNCRYLIYKNDSVQTLILFDEMSRQLFIESKKSKHLTDK
jgi:hypothetical protein